MSTTSPGARRRGWLAAAVAVALLLGLAGVALLGHRPGGANRDPSTPITGTLAAGRPPPPSTPAAGIGGPASLPRATAVRDLLERRAAALRRRDQAGFMATVDPLATPEFIVAQQALFTNLGGVPLSQWRYELDDTVSANLPLRPLDAAQLWAPRTTLRYGLLGADEVPTVRPLAYLYAQRGGAWYLTSDSELGPDTQPTWRGPWDFGPCVAVSTASGLVLGHPGQEQLLAAVAAELDAAVAAVTDVWGQQWARRAAVILPASLEEMRALVGPALAVDGIAAAAVADAVDLTARTAVGQRVVFNPDQAGRLSESARRIVLRHELTHVAARASTVDGAPLWLVEGFADYVGYLDSGLTPREAAPDLVRTLRAGQPPDHLPTDAEFHGAGGSLDLAYQLAWSAALHVVDRAGQDGLVQLYRMIAGDPRQDRATLDTAMREVLTLDPAGFLASWRDSLPARFG
jgi:hypothetical protein